MAVEKMKLVNISAPLEELHELLRVLIQLETIHVQPYHTLGESRSLTYSYLVEEVGAKEVRRYLGPWRYEKAPYRNYEDKLEVMDRIFQVDRVEEQVLYEDYDFETVKARIDLLYDAIHPVEEYIRSVQYEIEDLKEYHKALSFLRGMDLEMNDLFELERFEMRLGSITPAMRSRMKANYENIKTIILHIGGDASFEYYMAFLPVSKEEDIEPFLKSLNFKSIPIDTSYSGRPEEVMVQLEKKIGRLEHFIRDEIEALKEITDDYKQELSSLHSQLAMEKEVEKLKEHVWASRNFFFLSFWIPEREIPMLKAELEDSYPFTILEKKEAEDVEKELIAPTKLKNNKVIAPFETIVNIYGTPNYKEIDPTGFVALTYMIFFGAMFGDVGQGLVFFLIGLYLNRKNRLGDYAGILMRIGLSSTFFGLMYGSIFGNEHILPALFLRPMENTNELLLISVAFGVILLLCSFALSLYNLVRRKDYKTLLFGGNGLTGLALYLCILGMIAQVATGLVMVPQGLLIALMVLCVVLLLFKDILYGKMKKQPVEIEGAAAYFVEQTFDVVEILLSFVSNTISFIRIGAFALNHVGLFLAFQTLADMTGGGVAGVLTLILGNVIVMVLEGMIVMIQALRLEYYELFGKYYTGDGKSYIPVRVSGQKEEN